MQRFLLEQESRRLNSMTTMTGEKMVAAFSALGHMVNSAVILAISLVYSLRDK